MRKLIATCLAVALIVSAAPAFAAPEIGKPAPDFTGKDVDGKDFKLSDHKGKIVVLEWTNNECPYVVKHYGSGNMQKTQKAALEKGAEWVSIVSSAPGRQGNLSAEDSKKVATEAGATFTAKILDDSGAIGHAYDAKTTPHMFIIDAEGTLVYAGAIDDDPSPRPESVQTAKNYVLTALDEITAGKPVSTPSTQSYGCGVKYAD